MASFRDNLHNSVLGSPGKWPLKCREREYWNVKTVLDFAAARDDGGGSCDSQNSETCEANHCHHHQHSLFYVLDAIPVSY